MSAFLLKLLELSLQAGVLTVVILIVRLVFRKLPAKYLCVLWMIVAARLIVPFSIETGFAWAPSLSSLWNEEKSDSLTERLSEAYQSDESGEWLDSINILGTKTGGDYYIDGSVVSGGVTDVYIELEGYTITEDSDGNLQMVSDSPTPVPEGIINAVFHRVWRERFPSVTPVLFALWLLGVVLLLGYGAFSCFRVKRLVKNAIPYEENIWLCEGLKTPFLFGWIHPQIYLPTNLEETQLQYVIEHERAHIARGDNYAKIIGYALLSIYWFNLLIWVAYVMFCKDVERACDERVIGGFSAEDRKGYAEALLECSIDQHFAISNPLAFGEMDVKNRITSVLKYKKPGRWLAAIASLLCVAAVAGCFLVQKEDTEGNSLPEMTPTSVPTLTATSAPTQGPIDTKPTPTETPTPAEYVVVPANPREVSDEGLLGNATKETVLPVPLGQTVLVDLDGDGAEESVTFGIEGYEGKVKFNDIVASLRGTNVDIDDLYYLQIDDTRLSQAQIEEEAWSIEGVGFTYYIFDVDVNDGYKEIGIFFYGPNTPNGVYLYRFVDGSLQYIGGFRNEVLPTDHHNQEAPRLPYEDMVNYISREGYLISVPGDGTIYCKEITHLLQTAWLVSEYRLQNGETGADASLELVIRDHYEYSSWESGREEYYAKTTKIEFEAWAAPSMDADKVFVPEGSHVAIYEYVPGEIWGDGWVRIFYTVNEMWDSEAWLPVSETDKIILPDKELDADDIFENLSHAG